MAAPKKKGLGKGLDALFSSSEINTQEIKISNTEENTEKGISYININDIKPNKDQPRKTFDEEKIGELAESIKEHGLIQPVVLRKSGKGYEIVAGERRWRACRKAGLKEIPCIIKELTDEENMLIAIIENMQREDLNPIEEAAAIRSLMSECNYTQEEAAKRLGKSRPAIANALRLLNLPEAITAMVIGGELSAGHARVLAGLDSEEKQLALAKECVRLGYSVRKLEEAAKENAEKAAAPQKAQATKALPPELNAFQDAMREVLGVKTVLTGNSQKGKITISYNSADELEGIFQAISKLLL